MNKNIYNKKLLKNLNTTNSINMISNNYAKILIRTNNKMNNRNIKYNKLTKQELINIILDKNKEINSL